MYVRTADSTALNKRLVSNQDDNLSGSPAWLDQETIKLITESTKDHPEFLTNLEPEDIPDWYTEVTAPDSTSGDITSSTSTDDMMSESPLPSSTEVDLTTPSEQPELLATTSTIHANRDSGTTSGIVDLEPDKVDRPVDRPFAESDTTGYLLFSDSSARNSEADAIKQTLARELPSNVKLVIYTPLRQDFRLKALRNKFKQLDDENRLDIIQVQSQGSINYWARDGLPVPVFDDAGELRLIDAQYNKGFEQDEVFANYFNATLESHNYEFEGGNFLSDSAGNCFVINKISQQDINKKSTQDIPDDIFRDYYRCKRLTRLEHLVGIGHIDEVLKIIDSQNVLTDQSAYQDTLKQQGYNVTLLPRPNTNFYASYLNSVIINKKVFLPIFSCNTDEKAIEIYRSFGLEVITAQSANLVRREAGSIHCMTMTYPPV